MVYEIGENFFAIFNRVEGNSHYVPVLINLSFVIPSLANWPDDLKSGYYARLGLRL